MENKDKILNEAKYLLTDLIQGDESIISREDFASLTGEDIREALKLIVDNPNLSDIQKKYILMNVWRIHYKRKPPSIEEFLTTEWLGATALSIYDHVRKDLTTFWNPFSQYRHMVLAPAIGYGKSFECTISILYINTHLNLMRNPKRFFGLSSATSITTALISFSLEKAKQILLQPFYQILQTSPKFKRVRKEETLKIRQEEYPDKIVWTSAGKVGSIQFSNDLHILVASEPAHILGLTLIAGVLSEISFFIDKGVSPETIWRIYNDTKGRIYSRFGNKYFASSFLDSSPNDMDLSPIDRYIFSGKASQDPLNYVVTGAHWEYHPSKYPIWQKTGESFPVFRGSSTEPPKILTEEEIKNYNPVEIYHVPIDIRQNFEDDLIKSVKDYCGWPSGSEAKLFKDFDVIEDIFTPVLKNIYSYIYAPESQNPEHLIWEQIKDIFFVKLGENQYEFYRSPKEKRYIHIDQSENKDITSISMVHPELTLKGDLIIIADFTIPIIPTKGERINLDAISEFVIDLRDIGKINIDKITFDQYQSAEEIQRLKRLGFNVEKLSVDRTMNPYLIFVSWIKNKRFKAGKNIFLKNNLKSIQEVTSDKGRKKIDHLKGKIVYDDGGDWEISSMGLNAKDVSDSACGATFSCLNTYKETPRYTWKVPTYLVSKNETEKEKKKAIYNDYKNIVINQITERFALREKVVGNK